VYCFIVANLCHSYQIADVVAVKFESQQCVTGPGLEIIGETALASSNTPYSAFGTLPLGDRDHFSSDEVATKLIWLALRNITVKWTNPPIAWAQAKAQFAIQFVDRFRLGE